MGKRANRRNSKSLLRQHRYALKRVAKSMLTYRWSVAVNTLILGMLLALAIALFSSSQYLSATHLPHAQIITVYLEFAAGSSAAEQDNLTSRLKRNPLLVQATKVSGEKVLHDLLDELDVDESKLVAELNPFSDMVVVKLARHKVDEISLNALTEQWRGDKLIGSVEVEDAVAADSPPFEGKIYAHAGAILGSLILLSVALLCGNMVRAQLSRQHLEIEVTRYCGAEPAFIRRPFLYWGAIQAVLGTITALILVVCCWLLLRTPLQQIPSVTTTELVPPLSAVSAATIVVLGSLIGLISAWVATKIHWPADSAA
ncbi:MAG: cell division protein FtsX [Gammaproteobacteria bacterium]